MFYKEQWIHSTNNYLDNFDRQNELNEVYEVGDYPVRAFVPTNLIEDLLEHVESKEDD